MPLTGNTAACWASGGGKNAQYTASMFRADVLHLLPPQRDANGTPTGKRLVNDDDLLEQGLALNTVTLPETGTGNGVPQSAGATLFVVYRDPTEPLTKIVLYDGISVQAPGATTTQTIRGFLQSSTDPRAKITHIVGSGAPNKTDRLSFNGSRLATDPFQLGASPASDRAWSNPTFNVSRLMPGATFGEYGEEVTTTVDHGKSSPYDCLAWAAIIFSTTVKDTDDDGYPDLLESSVNPLKGPDGQALPDMRAMGADARHKDVFIEVGAMQADAGTTYGSGDNRVTDTHGHSHLPSPAVLKRVGDAFVHAPVVNPDGMPGINVHFDVGSPLSYHGLGGAYASLEADSYLVPAALARGGEIIKEVACVSTPTRSCQFPDYPGTVSWKIGYQFLRDAPVMSDGGEFATLAEQDNCQIHPTSAGCGRKRFDSNRAGLFRYLLYAHARGTPKSSDPTNPDFHVPKSASGISDLPGGGGMVTLGLWENFVGTEFMNASTTMHELGHQFELWHGGAPPRFRDGDEDDGGHERDGDSPDGDGHERPTVSYEENCKPNYLSTMSYLFQLHGLLDDAGVPHLDFSRDDYADLDETALSDGSVGSVRYRAAWYAPLGTPATAGIPAAKKFCSGASFPGAGVPVPMGRVEAPSASAAIDWNGDGTIGGAQQDVNFDGALSGGRPASPSLSGFNDWSTLRLNQLASGPNIAGFSSGIDFGGGIDFSGGID